VTPPPVLVVSGDPVGELMAGPAIRAVELTRALAAAGRDVTLAVPRSGPTDLPGSVAVVEAEGEGLRPFAEASGAVVVFAAVAALNPWLAALDATVVVDAYDPGLLETLERRRGEPVNAQRDWVRDATAHLVEPLAFADAVLVASDRQRHLVIGILAALGRLTPRLLVEDPALDRLVRTVPFGVPAVAPAPDGARPVRGPTGVLAGVEHVALWGGGLYDWLDPVTLVEAIAAGPSDVGAVFLAGPHPTPAVGEAPLVDRARARASELGLLGDRVAFHDRWVPYAERSQWLLDCTVGVSLHLRHLETELAFRTRVLDYLWAGLPVVCTEGDVLAELVAAHDLGAVVPPCDPEAVAVAIDGLVHAEADERAARAQRLAGAAAARTWPVVAAPLVELTSAPVVAPDRRVGAGTPGRLRRAVRVARGLTDPAQARW
jgi:hypothetical protein